jgi:hypothetical protein
MSRERSVTAVPRPIVIALVLALGMQINWHVRLPKPTASAALLPNPLSAAQFQVLAFGEPVALAKLLMLWLQAFDNQPGISIPFKALDYDKVTVWLTRILELDPSGQYPLLVASRLYGAIPVPAKQRQMLEFVRQQFLAEPDARWPWLAHAVYIAKHRMRDLPLALEYARLLAEHLSKR